MSTPVFVLVAVCYLMPANPGAAQSITKMDISDSSIILAHLNGIQTAIQRSRQDSVRSYLGLDAKVAELRDSSFADWLVGYLGQAPNRNTILSNPRPSLLGPLWDFNVRLERMWFYGDTLCKTECLFSLRAAGSIKQAGNMWFVKRAGVWYVREVTGIVALFRSEQRTQEQRKASVTEGKQ